MLKQGYEKVYYILNSHLLARAKAGATCRRFQTKPGLFKIAIFRRWIVVPSGPELIEEVMKAPDTAMAVLEPLLDVRTAAHIASRLAPSTITSDSSNKIHPRLLEQGRHVSQQRRPFEVDTEHRSDFRSSPRGACRCFERLHPDDGSGYVSYTLEARICFMYSAEWVKVSIMPTVQRIVCRASSRVLVGASLCA